MTDWKMIEALYAHLIDHMSDADCHTTGAFIRAVEYPSIRIQHGNAIANVKQTTQSECKCIFCASANMRWMVCLIRTSLRLSKIPYAPSLLTHKARNVYLLCGSDHISRKQRRLCKRKSPNRASVQCVCVVHRWHIHLFE